MPKQSSNKYLTVTEAKKSKKPRVTVAPHICYDTRTKKFLVELFYGWKPNGKPDRRFKTFKGFEEAQNALIIHDAERLERKKHGEGLTIRECIQMYIDAKSALGKLAATTKEGYENLLKRISRHPIADIKISHVKPYDLLEYTKMLQSDDYLCLRNGKNLSDNTIRKDIDLITSAVSYATRMDYIEKDPFFGKVDKPQKAPPTITTLPPEDISKICDLLVSENKWTLAVTFCLCVYQGFRRGECAGLKWEMISFDDNTIKVCETRTRVNTAVCKSPKTESGERYAYMHSKTREMLKRYREKLLEMGIDNEYVIISIKTRQPASVIHLSDDFTAFIRKHSELPKVTLHSMRHTYATEAIKHGADITSVSEAIGHSKVSTTLNMYTHPDEKSSERVNHVLEDIF